ncbi:MAG: sigma-70 family RNA polymerase sigma factor [Candidatus Poribacteria bacterium]|nr:sigma-70 family RNA polymerase sigma factor [Candidatus Poribacteria bacterium]
MVRDDVQLIHSILSGNDEAFSILVKKYQKSVHALAWRKIGDFHYAEEITQDTFLQAYKKLSTLKNPNQFAGWLYVIANRLCLNWLRKKKPAIQSLDGTSTAEIEKLSYARHVSEHRETEATERRTEIVRKLLARLPESERTVVSLYYLGEMTSKEIGKFLGVSVKTVHSRLHRARKRLQEKDELLISEVLGGVQLPTNLIESVMQQVADMKPTGTPIAKPLLPWAAFGAATVLIMLLLGASNQYLARFQQPYSFEAESELIIEIVDAPIVLDTNAKPAVRNQAGRAMNPTKSSGAGQTSETTLASNTSTDSLRPSISQWTRTNGPLGGHVRDIFATSEKVLYAVTSKGIYSLTAEATAWTLTSTSVPTTMLRMPMAEHGKTLYIVSSEKIFASSDTGETWQVLCSRPEGEAVGLIVVDEIQGNNQNPRPVMYLALHTKGIFRSTNAGAQWNLLENGLADQSVYAVTAVENTVFAGTNEGLHRLNSDVWQRLSVGTSEPVYSLIGFENNLYVGMNSDFLPLGPFKPIPRVPKERVERLILSRTPWDNESTSRIFHSTDLGASWTEITPKNESPFMSTLGMMIVENTGETTLLPHGVAAVDENTFYQVSSHGIHRTIDGGESWHPFMNGIMETMQDLTACNDKLYAQTGMDLVQSVDGGETWETVRIGSNDQPIGADGKNLSLVSQVATAGDVLYGIAREDDGFRVFHSSAGDDGFVPVQEVPTFERESSLIKLSTNTEEAKQKRLPNDPEKNENPPVTFSFEHNEIGGFAVNGQTFYVEYKHRLFKWKPGDSEWEDTGLIDTNDPLHESDRSFKLAVSGETIYVGKRNGRLFQSLDGGKSWKNITPTLPLHFTHFTEIVFAGSTVYVSTDEGVLSSQTGAHWRVLTDRMGKQIIIDDFAVDGTTIYGADDAGAYRLDAHDKWDQISQSVPDKIVSLVVSKNRLYIATQQRGVFHISIEDEL